MVQQSGGSTAFAAGEGGFRPDRRLVVAAGAALLGAPLWAATPKVDAVVGDAPGVSGRRFSDLRSAIVAAPAGDARYTIALGTGRFAGPFVIERANVSLIGRGMNRTLLSFAAGAGEIAADGKPYGTFRTQTLDVRAPGFRMEDLAVENAYDAPAEMRKPNGLRADEGGSQQAIALSLGRGSDRAVVRRCVISSHQDTLYIAEGRALFEACRISGSYDFIFGGGAVRFERCDIVSRPRLVPVEGYIAAPSTMTDQPAGLVFDHCRLVAEPGVPEHSVFLGRPWRLSTTVDGRRIGDVHSVGMAAYLNCDLGRHIAPAGWTRMWYTGRDGNPRTWFEPEDARFFEYRNTGPGAQGARRSRTLTATSAAALSRVAMFRGWNPNA